MARIREHVDRPPARLLEPFRDLPTAAIADVTPGECVMDSALCPVSSATTTVGTALTVATPPADNLTVHKAVTLAEPGDVLVVDAKGFEEAAIWGELLSTSALAHDLAGTVVDGAVRDAAAIGDMGYPVYARAVSPTPPSKAATGSINVPVTCAGVAVDPGDIVVADESGVAVVDPETAEQVSEAARAKLDREASLADRAAAGEYLYDVLDLGARYQADAAGAAPGEGTDSAGND